MTLIPCEICGHPFTHMHRLYLGEWGGRYEVGNVAYLCPNHHAAVHLFTKFYYTGSLANEDEEELFLIYSSDVPLRLFCLEHVKPTVRRRLTEEGKWHPYQRTLSTPETERERAREINKQEVRRKQKAARKRRRDPLD